MSSEVILDPDAPRPEINALECKSCGRCVLACPKKVLRIGASLNERGFYPVVYDGTGCVGCGNCFYACPEPSAIAVYAKKRSAV